MAAGVMGMPELALNAQQSTALASAIVDCADAWGWNPVTDPRLLSTLTLGGVCFMIYAPRVQAVKAKMRKSKELANGNIS
jgi:hypothetical protein